jgi:hypothetical protein
VDLSELVIKAYEFFEINEPTSVGSFNTCARHGALRASATSLAVVATLVTWG